jgi:nuclear-control-of-ATPase protein 2
MALAFAQEKLHYGPEQLEALSRRIRLGDLTSILRMYEEYIKHPLRSAITGTLIRALLVQVQKAKVCVEI